MAGKKSTTELPMLQHTEWISNTPESSLLLQEQKGRGKDANYAPHTHELKYNSYHKTLLNTTLPL